MDTSNLYKPTWAEIDLDRFAENIRRIKERIGHSVRIMPVIKADAYGCGAVEIAKAASEEGVYGFAVARPDEALELRKNGIKEPILLFGYVPDEFIPILVNENLTSTVYEHTFAQKLDDAVKKAGKTIGIHLKIDSGMHRLGVKAEDALSLAGKIKQMKHLRIEGVYSHFSVSDEKDKTYTEWQLERFRKAVESINDSSIILHTANSAAVIDMEHTFFNMIRAGIMIYGLYPSNEVKKENLEIRPVLSLKTTVAFCKRVEKGASVSYVRTWKAPKDTNIVTIPIGYADGWNRKLSNRGEVLIRGKRYPMAGNVCMDLCMADVGDDRIDIGEEAVLIGEQGSERITIEEVAEKIGTINYEVQCAIARRVPRVYRKNGKITAVRKFL